MSARRCLTKALSFLIIPAISAHPSFGDEVKLEAIRSVTYHSAKTGQDVVWNLVAQKRDPSTGKLYEVWQDSRDAKLWGSRLDSKSDQRSAEAKCEGAEGKRAVAGIGGIRFKLPSKKDFEDALDDGLMAVSPELDDWYWSSTVFPDNKYFGWESDSGSSGEYVSRDYKRAIICVSR